MPPAASGTSRLNPTRMVRSSTATPATQWPANDGDDLVFSDHSDRKDLGWNRQAPDPDLGAFDLDLHDARSTARRWFERLIGRV